MVEHLPSKCEALDSNPSTTKKKRMGKGDNTEQTHKWLEPTVVLVSGTQW
jgi:hypothetical protein